jgi:hypothetical protein
MSLANGLQLGYEVVPDISVSFRRQRDANGEQQRRCVSHRLVYMNFWAADDEPPKWRRVIANRRRDNINDFTLFLSAHVSVRTSASAFIETIEDNYPSRDICH